MRAIDLEVFALESGGEFKQKDELFARKLEIEHLHFTERYKPFDSKVENLVIQNRKNLETILFDYAIQNKNNKKEEKIFTGIYIQFIGDSFRPITFSKHRVLDVIHLTRVRLEELPKWFPDRVYAFVEGQYKEQYKAILQNHDQFGKIIGYPDFVALYCREQYLTCYFTNRYSTDKASLAEIEDRIQHLLKIRKPLQQIKIIEPEEGLTFFKDNSA